MTCGKRNTRSVILSTPQVLARRAQHLGMNEKPLDHGFARRFAECLRDRGWHALRQIELAEKLRVSQGMAGRYVAGKDKPNGRKLEEMALLFDVCTEWLRTGRGPKRPGADADDTLDMTGYTAEQKAILRAVRDSLTKHQTNHNK